MACMSALMLMDRFGLDLIPVSTNLADLHTHGMACRTGGWKIDAAELRPLEGPGQATGAHDSSQLN